VTWLAKEEAVLLLLIGGKHGAATRATPPHPLDKAQTCAADTWQAECSCCCIFCNARIEPASNKKGSAVVGQGLVDGVQVRGHGNRQGLLTTLAVLHAALGHNLDHAVDVLHIDGLLALLLRGQRLLGRLAHLLAHLLLLHDLLLLLLHLNTTVAAVVGQSAQGGLGQGVGQASSAGSCKTDKL